METVVRDDNRVENLRWGTPAENAQDCLRHGNHPSARKTHCAQGHEFTPDNIYTPPSLPNSRMCRECNRETSRRRRAEARAARS